MADQNMPNDASRKSKAEGDRGINEQAATDRDQRSGSTADTQGGGITNRPIDEEIESQQAVPDRGESKPGAHAGGGGDDDSEPRRSER